MAFERVAIFGLIDVDVECTGQGVLRLSTDLPATTSAAAGPLPAGWAVRETKIIPATGRRVMRFRLAGTTKGRLYILTIIPTTGVMRLYGAKIWARVLPSQGWEWFTVPVPPTSEEWQAVKLPIPGIGEWQAAKLPIPGVGEWQEAKLPIPGMGEWQAQKLPIKPTPDNPEWVSLEMDQ
jgi:hypothetical protein